MEGYDMPNKEMIDVWITRYALTQGILQRRAERPETDRFVVAFEPPNGLRWMYHKPYWHATLGDAKRHAEEMRLKSIESAKKRIKKLEALKVKVRELPTAG
jgi:hypothetical protein